MIRTCQKEGCVDTYDSPDTPRGNMRKYCDSHKTTYKKSPLTSKYMDVFINADKARCTIIYAKFLKLEREGKIETATMDIIEVMMFEQWVGGDKEAGKLLFGHKIPKQVEVRKEIHEVGEKAAEALSGKTPAEKAKMLSEAADVEVRSIVPAEFEEIDG